MPSPHEDRRVRRTKTSLREALLALILEKGYDRITVQDILDRADVGRSTFYAHYLNKADLLVGEMKNHVFDLDPVKAGTLVPSVAWLFEHTGEHYALYRALVGSEGLELFLSRLREQLQASWEAHLNALQADGLVAALPSRATAHFLSGGLIALLTWWLENKMPEPPQAMNRLFHRLAASGLRDHTQALAGDGFGDA